ncbi:lasso RiPP family leader peptide-containing protein [Tropicimonas isoalkanivorans]|uniref:lasso RiPP family leader peptide-containing protein n=1 Tax=Tropicimonas isoalkanivorans TaxID=441112 RepID=UPI001160BAEC
MNNGFVTTASSDDVSSLKAYQAPRLSELGGLSELTLAGSAGNRENSGADDQTIRRPNV